MILLVSGATATVRKHADNPHLGRLVQPRNGNSIAELAVCGMPWAADNDALQGLDPDELLAMWDQIAAVDTSNLIFCCCPDAVEMTPNGPRGSAEGTYWLWRAWLPALRNRGLPAAYVAQDGATAGCLPWSEMDALFIGGSDAFKLSEDALVLCQEARNRRIWVHVGRVNSFERATICLKLGADSFDGGQFSMFPNTYIPPMLKWLAVSRPMIQFEEAA